MAAEIKKEIALEIAHVLFIDIVGYSKLLINEQHALLDTLNQIVRGTEEFRNAEVGGRLIKIPTGDGMALVFYNSPEAPVECALEISRALKEHPELQLRMGVNSGPVSGVIDVNERTNVAGAGINLAQRIMDCGDAGHILLSNRVAEDLAQYGHWQPHLHDLGTCEVKHGVRVSAVNLYTDELGNPQAPEKFKQSAAPLPAISSNFSRRNKRLLIGAVVAAAVALAVGFWVFPHRFSLKAINRPSSVPPPSMPGSLAVLPLKNLSGDPAEDYFADGITDSLTTDLSHIHSLRVISFQSVQQYKGEHRKSLPEIARELNVDAVLEGSVQKSGDTVMINAQLVHAPSDQHLWAERYTRNTRDLMSAQNEIVLAITEAIKVKLTQQERTRFERARPVDPEAQSHYFLGRFQLGKGTEAGLRQAILEFEESTRKEPQFAPAYAGIADAYSLLSSFYMPPREAMPKAEEAARKALAIDPDLAEAHSAIGYVQIFYHWNPGEGERELLKAIELNPNYSTARLNYGVLLLTQSRFSEGLVQLRKAQEIEPTSAIISFQTEWALFLAGKYEETIAQCRHTLAIEPKMAGSHSDMGLAYLFTGNKKEALTELKKAVDLEPNSGTTTNYAIGLAMCGEKEEAKRVLNAFLERSKGKYICAYEIASAYEGMRERTNALEWLQRGYDEKCDCLVWGNTEPWMEELRKDPRYKAILAKTGLPQ